MPAPDVRLLSPDASEFGVNVARTQRLIAKLLADWVGDGRAPQVKRPYLSAIYFDKLAELFCRTWAALAQMGAVRYAPAFCKQRGFHGPGRALRLDRAGDQSFGVDPDDFRRHRWAFTTEIVEKLHPALGETGALFRLEGQAWRHECRVYPGIVQSQWHAWLTEGDTFLTATEVNVFLEFSRAVSTLDEEELRAIGTHCSSYETQEDIKFNLRSWESAFGRLTTPRAFVSETEAAKHAYRMVTTMREVRRKSVDNREPYRTAAARLQGACGRGSVVRTTIESTQHSDADIWENGDIRRFAEGAGPLLDLSVYTRRGLHAMGNRSALKDTEMSEADEALGRLRSPLIGVSLEPTPYETLVAADKQREWSEELQRHKEILFRQIPPVYSLEKFGVPSEQTELGGSVV